MLLLLSSLSFWDKTSGIWINTATILMGTLFGLALKGSLPLQMQRIITQISVALFLPALIVAPLLCTILQQFSQSQ